MFGHAPALVVADFWAGGVVDVDGVLDVDVDVAVEGVLDATVLWVPDAADALEMPAAAPPVASAPAIIVAPSILEMVIGSNLLGSIWWGVSAIVRVGPKPQGTRA
jgi:hypothetical protein